ncbi:MAG: 3-isopropylmalate dehydratase small subunit [bacterium]
MEPFKKITAVVAPLDKTNVDTDQIIPKQFLKRVERTGFGKFLFYDWRYRKGMEENPEFILNQPHYNSSEILLTRDNFGCGSSREHAPWALKDFGFRVIIAPSFADIFYNNCFQNGILPLKLDHKTVDELFAKTGQIEGYELTVDLKQQLISSEDGLEIKFEIDPFRRQMLLEGLDEIDITLRDEDKINAYEQSDAAPYPLAN